MSDRMVTATDLLASAIWAESIGACPPSLTATGVAALRSRFGDDAELVLMRAAERVYLSRRGLSAVTPREVAEELMACKTS